MEHIALWQLAADAGLVLGIIFLATRLVQSGMNGGLQAKIRSLELQLRANIREAQASAEEFEKTLDVKQKALEDLLFEVQATESRVRRTLEQAKEAPKTILAPSEEHRTQVFAPAQSRSAGQAEIIASPVAAPSPSEAYQEVMRETASSSSAQAQTQPETQSIPEPPSFQAKPNNPFFATMSRKTFGTGPKLNIFGEPIPGTDVTEQLGQDASASTQSGQVPHAPMGRAVARRQGLAAQVETFVDLPQVALPSASASFLPPREIQKQNSVDIQRDARPVQPTVEDIYAAAESFLRAGQTLEMVAARTRLPAEDVRMLSQIIERERRARDEKEEGIPDAGKGATRQDDRLGVLGSYRRTE
jgi:hypothetical protein